VDFELWAGEIYVLRGENGAGKTTLMNMLAGLYQPDAGEIRLRGRPVRICSPHQAIQLGIGMAKLMWCKALQVPATLLH
jgi:ABC-type uncharacterized transport systems, ATPase components, COG3845